VDGFTGSLMVELPSVRETELQFPVESYQRLKN